MTVSLIQSSEKTADGKRVPVTITYLEQCAPSSLPMPAKPNGKIAILRAEKTPLHFYRYLYRAVGDSWNWVSRRRVTDADLRKIIHDPSVYLYVLYVEGSPAGFAEIDARQEKYAELKFFGLMPEFIGQRLGRFFLANVLDLAWALGPKAIRLETCTFDHPSALPLYQKMGFSVIDRRDGVVELLD